MSTKVEESGVVTRVSKYGFQTDVSGDVWLNLSKFDPINLDGVTRGASVNYSYAEKNGRRYLKSLQVSGEAPQKTTNEPTKTEQPPATGSTNRGMSESQARAVAVAAAFGAALAGFLSKEATITDAVEISKTLSDRLTDYILTGSFGSTDGNDQE